LEAPWYAALVNWTVVLGVDAMVGSWFNPRLAKAFRASVAFWVGVSFFLPG